MFDDSSPPDTEAFRELRRVSRNQIFFGWNFYADKLPPASCVIVWDKKRRGMDQADCELAWTSFKGQSRIFEYRWNGMLQEHAGSLKEERIHATQKPIDLYRWIIRTWTKPGDKICDPYLGSGSSRIAAWDAGLDFWGYEIQPEYFRLQEERFQQYASQISLFN